MISSNKNFICPFCNSSVPIVHNTYTKIDCYFNKDIPHYVDDDDPKSSAIFNIEIYSCPTCDKVSFVANGEKLLNGISIPLYPKLLANQFPKIFPKPFSDKIYSKTYSRRL